MYRTTTLGKKRVRFTRILIDRDPKPFSYLEYYGHESRATRLVGDSNRFITVSFKKNLSDRDIKAWLEKLTKPGEGITFDDGKYMFLGYTESHLKAGHVLFFREDDQFTVEGLKDKFGDLKAVYDNSGYGKYAARLGLSFSSTVITEKIDPKDLIMIPDLTAADGSLTSNGCGLIRDTYASEIAALLRLPPDTAVFQIRLGGIKGVLTRCPGNIFDDICGCSGKKIAYRPSMLKYDGGPNDLEVQQVSKPPRTGHLNKDFIILLLTLGIPLSVFKELLEIQLDAIDSMATHRGEALQCIEGEVDAEADGFHQDLYEMLLAGHDMNEPYLATLLHRFQNTARDVLRTKLNIPVKGSAYLFGVVDHCSVLQEGQVYINMPAKGGPQVGPVATMRNPAHDPSGVRVLEAVNKPELKHLTNCIVFAASGTHSEPDRMAGGDLDGDLYFVIFDPLLIPEFSVPPEPRPKQSDTRNKTITIAGNTHSASYDGARSSKDMRTDAIEIFITLRCNFLLGELSNVWRGLVGSTPDLANLSHCKKLVPMIETVLDIVKSSGQGLHRLKYEFDTFKRDLRKSGVHAPDGWKNPLEVLAELVPKSAPPVMSFTCDSHLILRKDTSEEHWEYLVHEAEAIMIDYNKSLKLAIDADKEAKDERIHTVEKCADVFKAKFVADHFPAVENTLVDMQKYLLKASVWYFVGYENGKQSFAWLGARWLNLIKAMQCGCVPISVGARSTPLIATPILPPTTSQEVVVPASLPATQIVMPPQTADQTSGFLHTENSEMRDEFDFYYTDESDRESGYDTAPDDIAPLTAKMRTDRSAYDGPREIVRENSDDTLVEVDRLPGAWC
ncbi:RNA dependent RNA polymerase-domain-containing protein [Mycena galericulata]|nr:RNA dependent RNA polymerase-domain-containing protein [Mycena galericulata]